MMKQNNQTVVAVIVSFFIFLQGCDFIYGLLQKEGAEEKELVGEIVPFEQNSRVEEVQRLLKLYGFKVGKVDGVLGVNTRNAIADFQESVGLEVTRFVDNATWERLNVFEGYGLVIDGELNIVAIQIALEEAGAKPGIVDGKMGSRTAEAIKRFQKSAGLKADGKIGFRTLSELADYIPVVE